ncbi:hypothetical protein Taro_056363, partial [Colocasia esculenta]|nr:hypothetical protein [Colocasia esculenta]
MASKTNAAAAADPPVRKDLKEAFEELYVHSSFLGAFSSLLKDLENHLFSIDRSIEERFRELESGEQGLPASSPPASSLPSGKEEAAGVEAEVEPRPELKSLCVNMDGRGLLTFIKENRKDPADIYKELNAALRAAPDAAALVLDVMDAFYPAKRSREDTFDGGLHVNRRTCICLLERLHMISPEIKPAVRERAKKLAAEWEVLTTDAGQNLEAMAFLQLLVSYGIASEFEEDDLVDLLVSIAKKKEAVCICRNLGLQTRMA